MPFEEEFPYELDIGTISLKNFLEYVIPFDVNEEQVFRDIYHLEILNTGIKVNKDLHSLEVYSENNMGTNMAMELSVGTKT